VITEQQTTGAVTDTPWSTLDRVLDQRATDAQRYSDFTATQLTDNVARSERLDDVFHVPFS
jgi:hypothetical protein